MLNFRKKTRQQERLEAAQHLTLPKEAYEDAQHKRGTFLEFPPAKSFGKEAEFRLHFHLPSNEDLVKEMQAVGIDFAVCPV